MRMKLPKKQEFSMIVIFLGLHVSANFLRLLLQHGLELTISHFAALLSEASSLNSCLLQVTTSFAFTHFVFVHINCFVQLIKNVLDFHDHHIHPNSTLTKLETIFQFVTCRMRCQAIVQTTTFKM